VRKKRVLSLLLLSAVVIFAVVYYTTHREDFELLSTLSAPAIIVLVVLEVLMILCLGLQMKILTDHYALGLTFMQCFGLARITSMANLMFGFAAGASVKAVYLKRFHNLKYGSFIAATGIAGIIKLMIGGLFATVLLLKLGPTANFLLPIVAAISASTLLFLSLAHKIPQEFFSFWSVINDLVTEWRLVRHDGKMILQLVLLSILLFVIYSLEIYFAFEAFGINAPFSVSGVITAFDNLAGAVKLIPGNIGVKETIFGMLAAIYGIGVNQGVHAAVLHRVIRAVVSLLSSGFAYKVVSTDRKQTSMGQIENITSRIVG
jgi:putative heme transporter